MNFQKIIRTIFIVAGIAGVLLVPARVRAQQDVDPTIFDVNPGVPERDAAAPVRTADTVTQPVAPDSQTVASADAVDAAQVSPADNFILTGLMVFAGLTALRGMALARRRTA